MPKFNYTKDDVLAHVKDEKVKFIRLQFSDMLGFIKNVEIPASQLKKALDGEMMFDGSSIDGFVRIEESDMLLMPDPTTFTVFPWHQEHAKTARLICNINRPDGTPFEGCPRNILKKAVDEAKKMGFTPYAGPEAEFFLFRTDEKGRPTTKVHDQGGYFDMSPMDLGEDARTDIVIALENMGFEVEASHHESAPGQNEIDFKYDDMITTADNVATFKFVVKTVAAQKNLYATFMPKPLANLAGSGMHINQSLFTEQGNAFFDPSKPMQLSDTCMHYIAGVLNHAKGMMAITNPTVNSYKRLVPGHEAPVYVAWSEKNRSPLVRIPSRRGSGTRIEIRNPDPSCNPYLALAVTLQAGLDGIKRGLTPPQPVYGNIYEMDTVERKRLGVEGLPANLYDALEAMNEDGFVREVIGDHLYNAYMNAKLIEWDQYRKAIHEWEYERYLHTF